MRRIRRNDTAPRLEMTPMIDVVFLLLCFFIFAVTMMINAQVLPVKLTSLQAGGTSASGTPAPGDIQAVTIDKIGKLYLNRRELSAGELDLKMKELAARPDRPRLYLALEAEGLTDRGPMLIRLIGQARAAGLQDFVIVGPPEKGLSK